MGWQKAEAQLLLLSTTMSIVIFTQLRSFNVTVEEMGQKFRCPVAHTAVLQPLALFRELH